MPNSETSLVENIFFKNSNSFSDSMQIIKVNWLVKKAVLGSKRAPGISQCLVAPVVKGHSSA